MRVEPLTDDYSVLLAHKFSSVRFYNKRLSKMLVMETTRDAPTINYL
jgi:hypothetical protein